MKINPGLEYIGLEMSSSVAIPISLRQGKQNVIHVTGVKVSAVNATGRRLHCTFELNGKDVMTRRVYREHVDRMIDKFEDADAVIKYPS